jgi:lipoprotein-anchoring transpeptidase ErfK/SrfK
MTAASAPSARRVIGIAGTVAAAAVAGAFVVTHSSQSHNGVPVPGAGRLSSTVNSAAASRPPAPAAARPTTSAAHAKPARTVRVTALENDGATYGVGMPIVLYFSPPPTDPEEFEAAVHVTVDGAPADGGWYWEQPTADEVAAHTVEAHYRLRDYWPANSRIHVDTPIGGRSAGSGLVYSGKLSSLDYKIGDAHVSQVDANGLRMRVTSNGKTVRSMPVSLGEAKTPTFNGTKVVMQLGENIPGTDRLRPNGTVLMSGPHYTDHPVQWSVRITRSGEYVHAAPWNGAIGVDSTSNGCTNLHTADGEWFYHFSQVGDVVTYAHTDGSVMPSWDGLGDWNLSWSQWTRGGLLAP